MTDGNDPKEVQEEAKRLKPNRDAQEQEQQDGVLEQEFGSEDQQALDAAEHQYRPLTDPEDNAKVDRVVPDPVAARVVVARGGRDYLVSASRLRALFVGSSIAAVLLVVTILTLASTRDRARYTPADETQYQRTLTQATEAISTFRQAEGGQPVSIPIDQAMAVVAQEGLGVATRSLGGQTEVVAGESEPTQAEAPPAAQPAQPAPTQPAPTQPAQPAAQAAAPAGAVPEVLTAGQAAYEANCASCHQATGAGVAGAFPPLAGHTPALYNADRSYLINLLLYGLQGEINVLGQTYNGVMPAWQQLSDEDIADILNYTSTAWENNRALENFQPYTPEEITQARGADLSSADVYEQRQGLGLDASQ